MIVEAMMTLCTGLVQLIFGWVSLPAIPESAQTALNTYFGYIFDNLSFLNFFLNVGTLKTVATIAISLYAFEHIYKIMIWVIRKIPLSID